MNTVNCFRQNVAYAWLCLFHKLFYQREILLVTMPSFNPSGKKHSGEIFCGRQLLLYLLCQCGSLVLHPQSYQCNWMRVWPPKFHTHSQKFFTSNSIRFCIASDYIMHFINSVLYRILFPHQIYTAHLHCMPVQLCNNYYPTAPNQNRNHPNTQFDEKNIVFISHFTTTNSKTPF